jgi:AraC-like DNA-binding protein
MGGGIDTRLIPAEETFSHWKKNGLQVARFGGGGEITKLVCGYLVCEPQLSSVVLCGLPRMIRVNIRGNSSSDWLENSIRFSVMQASSPDAGGQALLTKLSEALFVETIRQYIQEQPAEQSGWVAGVRDPDVGRALALFHQFPKRPWTIADLAGEVGISRSVLAERFTHYMGEPPMSYLTRWRLQLGAQMLAATSRGVADIAAEVGYESEPAFNRAFKRAFELPPARYRSKLKAGRAGAQPA